MPGRWLLAIARIAFSDTVVTRVVEPTVADFRAEWLLAGNTRSARLTALIRGYRALGSVLAISPFMFWKSERRTNMPFRSRISLVLAMIGLGVGVGYVAARMQTPDYRSTAVIQLLPAKVPEGLIGQVAMRDPDALASRLRATQELVLSRTRLERVINELNLFVSERRSMIMEDVVARMRRRIAMQAASGSTFRISYTGSDPATVLKVTEKLSAYFIEEGLKTGERRAEGTQTFLERRIDETAGRLASAAMAVERAGNSPAAMPLRMELEVLQNSYKNLLTRREESLGSIAMERQQIGEQFNLLEPPLLPTEPIGRSQTSIALAGGLAGLTVAALVLLVDAGRRRLRRQQGNVPREAV